MRRVLLGLWALALVVGCNDSQPAADRQKLEPSESAQTSGPKLDALVMAQKPAKAVSVRDVLAMKEGETVVVLGHMEGRAKATGTRVKVPFAHVWRMSGGKVTRGQAFTDTAVVADALGS